MVIMHMNANQPPLMATKGICMDFGGVNVLKNIDFEIRSGTIHGLIGENGAGKSTLLKILAGVYQPKSGTILLNGEPIVIHNPHAAGMMGIALIHQEPLTFPDLDVAENIFVGRQPVTNGIPVIDWSNIYRRADNLLKQLGVDLNPHAKVRGMSIADQQMIEIAGALSQNAKILLMDEPTAALTSNEVNKLFNIMRKLRDEGTAIVFISHRLEEMIEISDEITVLRDGEKVGECRPKDISMDDIIQLMVGRKISTLFEKVKGYNIGKPVLEVSGLSRAMKFEDISFDVREGEIVGMAGLIGSGQRDVARALFGTLGIDRGTVKIAGEFVKIRHPRDAVSKGLIYLPEDRQAIGLLMPMSVMHNVTLAALEKFSPGGWLREKEEKAATQEYIDKLRIVLRSMTQPVRELSGGNQQKVALSKWLLTKPKIMILDEPTHGIDVGAKAEVHRLMGELASQGIAILMISSELPEILAMSDRIIVMHEGRITSILEKNEATAEKIMAAATGLINERA